MKKILSARFDESFVALYAVAALLHRCSHAACLFALAVAGAGGLQAGTVYVKDSVVTNGTDSYTIANLAAQSATNSTLGLSKTGIWPATGTTVFQVNALGLAYPGNILLDEAGGSFSVMHTSATVTDGRMLTRTMSGLTTSGPLYFSLLLRVGTGFTNALANSQSVGMGLGTWGFSGTLASPQVSTNGVHFGFQKSGGTPSLMLRVNGTNYVLVVNPVPDQTYLCVAKVELGAGPGGEDIVHVAVDPSASDSFSLAVTNRIVATGTTFTNMTISGTFGTNGKRAFFDEYRIGSTWADVAPIPEGAYPAFNNPPAVAVDGANAFVFSATLDEGSAETAVIACYGTAQGSASASSWELSKLVTATPTLGVPATTVLDNLVTNTSYYYAALATNAAYSVLKSGGTLLMGEVWLTLGADAFEEGLVAGSAVVRRPASATQTPLTVNYTVAGSAVAGVNYVSGSLPGSVTIPAGQDSVAIPVLPRVEVANMSDTTVVLTLAVGAYFVGASNATTVTIQNYDYPADKNCWIATAAGNASVAANWSQNRVPNASDAILLDLFSTANMTWDVDGVNGLSDTVVSWTQTSNYTGIVTFPVQYTNVVAAVFTNFVIAGNATINGGKWTHPLNTSSTPTYRMAASVGGDFTLGAAASIDVSLKGYNANVFHSGSALGVHGGSCGNFSKVYDSPYKPFYPGSGGLNYAGGGAVWIDCTGAVAVNGSIKADSVQDTGVWNAVSSGAGGSVYVVGQAIAGTGTISAKSSPISRNATASGGRIALETTVASTIALPAANLSAVGSSGIYAGSGGTVVTKTASQSYGTLMVANVGRTSTYGITYPSHQVTTPVVGTWTFDSIKFSSSGILSVPTGSKLVLPSGFASISGANKTSGILYYGGEIDPQGVNPYTFSSNWVFQAGMPYVVTGSVAVVDNGAIGCLQLDNNSTANWSKCVFSVVGNMHVSSNSWIYGRASGFDFTAPGGDMTSHGGQQGSSTNIAYGSILNPVMPGAYGYGGDGAFRAAGGGAITLTVSGNLNLEGKAESSGYWNTDPDWNARGGPGGSLNFTAGTLTGEGTITAPGTRGAYNNGSGWGFGHTGGGRVAVRLTDAHATFDGFGVSDISAKGGSIATVSWTNSFSSAGTVYLQAGNEAEGAGRVIIRNDNNPNNVCPVTLFPSQKHGGSNDDFSKASLFIEDFAIVKLSAATLQMVSAEIETGSSLDLNGKTLTLGNMTVGGTRLAPGTYPASYFAAGVIDSSVGGTGQIVIKGKGTLIRIF